MKTWENEYPSSLSIFGILCFDFCGSVHLLCGDRSLHPYFSVCHPKKEIEKELGTQVETGGEANKQQLWKVGGDNFTSAKPTTRVEADQFSNCWIFVFLKRRMWSHKSWFPLTLPCIASLTKCLHSTQSLCALSTLYDIHIHNLEEKKEENICLSTFFLVNKL